MLSENTTASNLSIISDKNNCVKIRADLQDTSEWNRNRRKYPMKTVKSGLYSERVQELIRFFVKGSREYVFVGAKVFIVPFAGAVERLFVS